MAVKRRKRRPRPQSKSNTQRSLLSIVTAIFALILILGLGENFGTSAAGCYAAVTHPEEKASPQAEEQPSTESAAKEEKPLEINFRVDQPEDKGKDLPTAPQ